jgi:hypothetical protein
MVRFDEQGKPDEKSALLSLSPLFLSYREGMILWFLKFF